MRWLFPLLVAASCAELPATAPARTGHRGAADLHVHLTNASQSALFRGEPGTSIVTGSPGARLVNQIDDRAMLDTGVQLVIAGMWSPLALRPDRDARQEVLQHVRALQAFTDRDRRFAFVRSSEEARAVMAQGRIATFASYEGAEGLERPEDVDLYFGAGIRSLTPAHFSDSALSGAAASGQIGITRFSRCDEHGPGLTELGRRLVKRMIALGMVLDVSHVSEAAAKDMLDLAEEAGVPVIDSHTASRALTCIERNVSDDIARRIGKGGGLVGVTVFRGMAGPVPEGQRFAGFVPGTCDEVVAHWLHLAQVAGPEAVTLGSDFNAPIDRAPAGGACPHGLRNTRDLPALYAALEAHGVPAAALSGSAERLLKIYERAAEKADPELREAALRMKLPVPAQDFPPF